MKLTLECDQFAVFDDVLPADRLAALWSHVEALPFRDVDTAAPSSPWTPTDGRPQTGPAVAAWLDPARSIADSKLAPFPTGTAIDPLIELLLEPSLRRWSGDDWSLLTAIAWRYPVGSALSWHTDGALYSGGFAFYFHPVWDPSWGGELVFAHPAARADDLPAEPEARRLQIAARIAEHGIGDHVVPRPNRLVVLAGGHPHRIAPVEPAAGNHVRATIAGFYVRTALLPAHGGPR
jgi:hypothetical protein